MRWPSLLLLPLFAFLLPAQSSRVLAALSTGSYFPLEVGNCWVYRIDNRGLTAGYQTWRVDRMEERNGKAWSVFAIQGPGDIVAESLFRTDEQGRIFLYNSSSDKLFFDPGGDSAAALQITGRVNSLHTSLGNFPDALFYQNSLSTLILENGALVRGMGVVSSRQQMISGSSGGPYESRTLVEAALAGGKLRYTLDAPAVQLGAESLTLDVSGKKVTNCAVPCYFVACGLVPGADPPDTYKPCARIRVELQNWPSGAAPTVRLQLFGPNETSAYERTMALDHGLAFLQLPLYTAPNQPLPPGAYRLLASTENGSAALTLNIH